MNDQLIKENIGLAKQVEALIKEVARLNQINGMDGTTSGLPTSQTPIPAFSEEMRKHLLTQSLDDAVIMVNQHRACLRLWRRTSRSLQNAYAKE